jgi:aldose 1-epimerase
MKRISCAGLFLSLCLVLAGCCNQTSEREKAGQDSLKTTVMKSDFGTVDGKAVYLFTLTNAKGIIVKITNYGAIITQIWMPDRNGTTGDIVLGYDRLSNYITINPYFGCIAGRYANRIAKGKFTLDGKTYTLAVNNGENHLHGGIKGFDKVVWNASEFSDTTRSGVILTYLSKDGEEGYPGNLKVTVRYTLDTLNELTTLIEAETDKPTPVNLCNHTYFNLSGANTSILNHILEIFADRYTEVDDGLIPTGILPFVKNTPMDFLQPHAIGERITSVKGGYDHNYVLNRDTTGLIFAARLFDPFSGREVEIYTTQPGIQFYSGNFLDDTITGKNGIRYNQHYGLCLETQHFPDSPNQQNFPNTILRPGEKYREETRYRFIYK